MTFLLHPQQRQWETMLYPQQRQWEMTHHPLQRQWEHLLPKWEPHLASHAVFNQLDLLLQCHHLFMQHPLVQLQYSLLLVHVDLSVPAKLLTRMQTMSAHSGRNLNGRTHGALARLPLSLLQHRHHLTVLCLHHQT